MNHHLFRFSRLFWLVQLPFFWVRPLFVLVKQPFFKVWDTKPTAWRCIVVTLRFRSPTRVVPGQPITAWHKVPETTSPVGDQHGDVGCHQPNGISPLPRCSCWLLFWRTALRIFSLGLSWFTFQTRTCSPYIKTYLAKRLWRNCTPVCFTAKMGCRGAQPEWPFCTSRIVGCELLINPDQFRIPPKFEAKSTRCQHGKAWPHATKVIAEFRKVSIGPGPAARQSRA